MFKKIYESGTLQLQNAKIFSFVSKLCVCSGLVLAQNYMVTVRETQ